MASAVSEISKKRKQLVKSDTVDSCHDEDSKIPTLGENSGLGRVLLGIRFNPSTFSLDVRVVRGDGLRRYDNEQSIPTSTYCSVIFLPDCTQSVTTATVESAVGCPRWRGAFRFEKFPRVSTSQRCMQVQVHDASAAAGSAPISEANLLLSNWSQDEFESGIRVWKYLNGTQDTQRASSKEGNAFLTLSCRPDKFKLMLNRIEDLNSESQEFHCRLQAYLQNRGLIKESTIRGYRASRAGEVDFFDGEFTVRLNKHLAKGGGGSGGGLGGLTIRMVLISCKQQQQQQQQQQHQQEICWLELGFTVKRMDCRGLYQSVVENPNQSHIVSVRMNRPPVPELSQIN